MSGLACILALATAILVYFDGRKLRSRAARIRELEAEKALWLEAKKRMVDTIVRQELRILQLKERGK